MNFKIGFLAVIFVIGISKYIGAELVCHGTEKIPHEEDCRSYYACRSPYEADEMFCRRRKIFDPKLKKCNRNYDAIKDTPCFKNWVPPKSFVPLTFPATVPATDPTTVPAADPTTVPATDPTTVPAANPTTVPATDPTTVPAADPTTVTPVIANDKNFMCTEEGPIPYEEDCTKLYLCRKGHRATLLSCPADFEFDREKQICNLHSEVKNSACPKIEVPTRVSTTVPATDPTTVPATDPTTVLAADPTTVPTRVPTTVPATLPTTVPQMIPEYFPTTEKSVEEIDEVTMEPTIANHPSTVHSLADKNDKGENEVEDENGHDMDQYHNIINTINVYLNGKKLKNVTNPVIITRNYE